MNSDTTAFIRDGYDGLISKETIITGTGNGIAGTVGIAISQGTGDI